MTLDAFPRPNSASSAEGPAASLTMVRVKRRKPVFQPTGKRGDLTQAYDPNQASAAPSEAAPATPLALVPAPEVPFAPVEPEPAPVAAEPALPPAAPSTIVEFAQEMPEVAPPPEPAEDGMPDVPRLTVDENERDSYVPFPGSSAAPEPAEAQHASEHPPEPSGPRGADDIIDYWDLLRRDRDIPAVDDIDRGLIAICWPNSVLLSFTADTPKITRLGEPNGEIEYNAMVTDWILSRGKQSVKFADPMEEEKHFPVADGRARYRLLLLPFSGAGFKSEHVLCHLSRLEELSVAASFKRWLAS
jgi:hypothetical protein